ncbi:MAG: site-2 protease family protein [Cyanophyceae cyanobacterium]
MQAGWRIGSIFGIPLLVDPSWFLILILYSTVNGSDFYDRYAWGVPLAAIAGLLMALLLFGSVLLHELGHSLVARSQGIQVNSITLFMFGGVASIDRESKTPGQAFWVAVAGPAVSFMLFLLLGLLAAALSGTDSPVAVLANTLSRINLVLAIFNLIPGLPLDGGQILKALVWKVTGNRFKGIHWAAQAGQVLGWLAVAFGLYITLSGGGGGLWIALLGWFCARNANAYDRLSVLQEALLEVTAGDAMVREFRTVNGELTLRQFVENYLLESDRPPYFAAAHGRYQGLVRPEALQTIERSRWDFQTVGDLAEPLDTVPTVRETTPLATVVSDLERLRLGRLTVLSPADAVAGTVDRGDAVRAIAQKLGFRFSEADIRRIKTEGTYPPGLNLAAIAQTLDSAELGASRSS